MELLAELLTLRESKQQFFSYKDVGEGRYDKVTMTLRDDGIGHVGYQKTINPEDDDYRPHWQEPHWWLSYEFKQKGQLDYELGNKLCKVLTDLLHTEKDEKKGMEVAKGAVQAMYIINDHLGKGKAGMVDTINTLDRYNLEDYYDYFK